MFSCSSQASSRSPPRSWTLISAFPTYDPGLLAFASSDHSHSRLLLPYFLPLSASFSKHDAILAWALSLSPSISSALVLAALCCRSSAARDVTTRWAATFIFVCGWGVSFRRGDFVAPARRSAEGAKNDREAFKRGAAVRSTK